MWDAKVDPRLSYRSTFIPSFPPLFLDCVSRSPLSCYEILGRKIETANRPMRQAQERGRGRDRWRQQQQQGDLTLTREEEDVKEEQKVVEKVKRRRSHTPAHRSRCCCCTAMRQSYVGRESGWCSLSLSFSLCLCFSPSLILSSPFLGKP